MPVTEALKAELLVEDFKLSKEWKRYFVKVPIGKGRQYKRFMLNLFNKDLPEDVTVWIDAVQYERGNKPSEFQP